MPDARDQIIADARQRLRDRLMDVSDADDSVDVDDAYDVAMEQIRRVVKEDRAALAEQIEALPTVYPNGGGELFAFTFKRQVLAVVAPDAGRDAGSKP